jgi:uncharacterized protein (TIGR00251 family)
MQIILLHVIPKASRNEIVGWVDTADGGKALKIKVTATPEDGKANAAILKFLAKEWGISPSQLEITAGHTGRHKRLKITGAVNLPLP